LCFVFWTFLNVEQENGRFRNDRQTNNVCNECLSWPTSESFDNTPFLEEVYALIVNEFKNQSYRPSMFVWKRLINNACKGDKPSRKRLRLASKAFDQLLQNYKHFQPDSVLLQQATLISQSKNNASLLADLIVRSVNYDMMEQANTNSTSNYPYQVQMDDNVDDPAATSIETNSNSISKSRLSLAFSDIMRAMEVCYDTVDANNCRVILHCIMKVYESHVLTSNMRSLCIMALKTFSKAGDINECDQLLIYMIENNLSPRCVA
jgi:hypothetical protein